MRHRFGLPRAALTVLALIWAGAAGEVRADAIRLKSGEEIEGSIVEATRNTVVVRRSIGGMRQMRAQDIDEVRIDLTDGERISGRFLSWAEGVYQLRSGGRAIRIRDGAILSPEPRALARGQSPRESAPAPEAQPPAGGSAEPAASGAEPTAAPIAQGKSQTVAVTPSVRPAEPAAAARPAAPAAAGKSETVAVKASVGRTKTGADAMVFTIELSQPAEQPVVLIYGTLDGTAKAGKDYEAQQGLITLPPGAASGEVQVPLITGQPSQGDKRFELFLIADPKVAEVIDKRIIATIEGED
jgi:RNase P/RNase MRP subunit p29